VRRLAVTDNIVVLARELGLERRLLYGWRDAFASGGAGALRRAGRPSKLETIVAALAEQSDGSRAMDPTRRIAELERKIGEQQQAPDFFVQPCGMSGSNA
jgi:hypothetical protein